MVIPRDGELLLRFSGFGDLVGRGYTVTLADAAAGRYSFGRNDQVPRDSWQMKMLCIAGPCTLSIAVDGLGLVESFLGIEDGASTEIRILARFFHAE